MSRIYEKAYAKINIGLKVGNKRSDGFHNIETLMACVDLWDDIYLEDSEKTIIEGMDIPYKDNLIYKVITLLKDKYEIDRNVKVTIKKRIPLGSGLGGGSSDAAAMFRGLNKLWSLNLSIATMEELGQKIGSDVSFFITSHKSIVKGKGEVLKKVNFPLPYKILLVNLPINISTKTIYENYESKNSSKFEYSLNNWPGEALINDLESVYLKTYPEVFEIISNIKIDLQGIVNLMSGSGPTVFGLYNIDKNVNKIKKAIEQKYGFGVFELTFK